MDTPLSFDPTLTDAYRALSTSLISDNLDRLTGAVGLRAFHTTPRLVGRAFTVKTRPGDNLFVHLALDLAAPGDVIVVDAGGDVTNALVGEIMRRYAESRGIAGFVIDGAIRDADTFAQGNFQCLARAVSHRGPYKNGPGTVRDAVSIGGMTVHHGDLIVADGDGVIAIRPDVATPLLARVQASLAYETELMRQISVGEFDRSWLNDLRAKHQ